MSFEDNYLAERRQWEEEADRIVDALQPLAPRRNLLETSYELMDAAIFHILHPADSQTRHQTARLAFRALLLNRNLDHVPAYAAQLSNYLDVVDPDKVLERALQGQQFLFAGFHTGPYWSIFQSLVEKGLEVTTLFPGTLESKRGEIEAYFSELKRARAGVWNGRVLLLNSCKIEAHVLRGTCFETDYASFCAWRAFEAL